MKPFRPIEMDSSEWPELRRLLELACPTELKFVQDGNYSYKINYGPLEGFLNNLYVDQYDMLRDRVENVIESLNAVIVQLDLNQYLYQVMDNRTLAQLNYVLAEFDDNRRRCRLPTLVEMIKHELGLFPGE